MKKVSIIIPAYNKSDYTRRTVDSVLAQTYSDIEIIVVDDGSRDNTVSAMTEYGSRIRLIQKANGGACSARNEGIRRATGEYLAFIDCDDLYCPDKIRRCVEYLDSRPEAGFVYTAAYFIDEDDRITGIYRHPRSVEGKIAPRLIMGNFICNSTVVARRTALEKTGMFDETIFTPGDWDLWLRLSTVSEAGYIREPLTKYRVTDNYIFNRLPEARREEMVVLDKFFQTNAGQRFSRNRAYACLYVRFAQCYFLKKQWENFWSDCRAALKRNPLNIKACVLMCGAVLVPGWLNRELTKKILRRGA